MVTLYEFYLWAHIFMAIVWVGGSLMIQVLALRILKANEPARLAGFAKDVEWVGTKVFAPASLILVIFGFLLVEKAGWGYPFWVVFPLVIWALSVALGIAFLGPERAASGSWSRRTGSSTRRCSAASAGSSPSLASSSSS